MIAKLTGIIDSISEDSAVIEVAGVGYLVFCSARTLKLVSGDSAGVGSEISLAVETHVREDHIHLYGFADSTERDWFKLLTKVQGVGAKVALAILSALSPKDLSDAVLGEDKSILTRAQGVGPRLAVRILSELRDKVVERAVVRPIEFGASSVDEPATTNDAISALVNLGYPRVDAYGAVAHAAQQLGQKATVEALVKAGLRELTA